MSRTTIFQKRKYEEAMETMGLIFGALLMAEAIAFTFAIDHITPAAAMGGILTFNLLLSVAFFNRQPDHKKILADQKKNFNLPIKKVAFFDRQVKEETDAEVDYFSIKTIHSKVDMTVQAVELSPLVETEYKFNFAPEIKKPFEDHVVYEKLIEYYNRRGEDYGLKPVEYDTFLENMDGRIRGEGEFAITSLYLKLISKRIPIRISQLIQHAGDRRYLKNYIYFLMSLESKKIPPAAVLYAKLHGVHHKNIRRYLDKR